MLFKPDEKDDAKIAGARKPSLVSRILRRMVSLTVLLVILGGLGYIGWYAFQAKPAANRGGPGARLDLPGPGLAATPRTLDVSVYLDGVGSGKALNNVIVRAQGDGKMIAGKFTEGQEGQKRDGACEN